MGLIMKNKFLVILSLFHFSLHSVEVNNLVVPNGFKASLFANNLDAPRQIAEGDKGYIFVGSKKGIVYALKDNDKNGQIDDVKIIFDGLNDSSGVAYSNGSLFIAEIDKVWRVDNIEDNLDSFSERACTFPSYSSRTFFTLFVMSKWKGLSNSCSQLGQVIVSFFNVIINSLRGKPKKVYLRVYWKYWLWFP